MEPRSFDRGNGRSRTDLIRRFQLQWSRDLSIAETYALEAGLRADLEASMEPRSFDRGNVTAERRTDWPSEASMEPRSFDRGNRRGCGCDYGCNGASMEPRSFDRGNNPWCARAARPSTASMEPRSFDRGNATGGPGMVVCLPKLQWSRDLSIAETQHHRWHQSAQGVASMEPRSFDRGNMLSHASPLPADSDASMEPRSFDRGNILDALQDGSFVVLQWSRDLSIAETQMLRGIPPRAPGFNGAAIFRSRKPPAT